MLQLSMVSRQMILIKKTDDMTDLFQAVIDHVEHPDVDVDGPFQMQISSLDYSNFTGTIGIGRIQRGRVKNKTLL